MAEFTYDEEFPDLRPRGLFASKINGDGNCLFNALSDQLYGTQNRHLELRAGTIAYMQKHADYYKSFLEVFPGGGTRRNPKRKTTGTYNSNNDFTPSAADFDRVFSEHIERMSKGGTWGDNMEITAFANAYNVNIVIHQTSNSLLVSPRGEESRSYLHIAYHVWEHYSSVRNIDGPYTGPPHVRLQFTPFSSESSENSKPTPMPPPSTPQWQINTLSHLLPAFDKTSIKNALEQSGGNVDDAYEKLINLEYEQRSISSQQSSSVDRELESGDESGPNKRQDRRLSRASKNPFQKQKLGNGYRKIGINVEAHKDSLESLINATHPWQSPVRGKSFEQEAQHREADDETQESEDDEDDEDEMAWMPTPLIDGDTSSNSEYNSHLSDQKHNAKQQTPLSPDQKKFSKPRSAATSKQDKKRAQKQANKERKKQAARERALIANPAATPVTNDLNHPASAASALVTLRI